MALDARDFRVTGQWAKSASTTIPPIPISGQTYRKSDMTQGDAESGQAYDIIWESARNNQKDYETTGMALECETYGWPRWSPLTTRYVGGASFTIGTDGIPYHAVKDSGQGTSAGPVDPTTDTKHEYWESARDYFGGNGGDGSGMVLTPEIVSPENGSVDVPLTCQVTSTELQLAEGIPFPESSHYQVLDEANDIVFNSDVIPYTTSLVVDLPDVLRLYGIRVRHEDADYGWSNWSRLSHVTSAPTGIQRPRPVYPPNGSLGMSYYNLTLQVTPLSVKGATAQPSTSRFRIADNYAMDGAIDSGVIPYTTTWNPGPLVPEKTYYWQAQHTDAVLGPTGFSQVSQFTTQAGVAPDMSGFSNTVPSTVVKQTSTEVAFFGATCSDGSAVTYELKNVGNWLTFSKYSNISPNEGINMSAGSIPGGIEYVSFQVVAKSQYGVTSNPVTITVAIIAQTEWLYTASNNSVMFPVKMWAKVYVGGGGNGSYYGNPVSLFSSGAGGGCAIKTIKLYPNLIYQLIVGYGGVGGTVATAQSGGSSSFTDPNTGLMLTATGGQKNTNGSIAYAAIGGYGVNGDENYSGGSGIASGYGTGGGGGAGTSNGGVGTAPASPTGTPGYGGPGGGIGTGVAGSTATYGASTGYGGNPGVAGGGGGYATQSTTQKTASGGRGSIYVEFVRGILPGEE